MKEYIERGALLQKLAELYYESDPWSDVRLGLNMIKEVIENQPTADVQEVVNSKWLLERDQNGNPYCFHCSVCDDDFHHTGIKTASDFCPNCGAKTDKEIVDNEIFRI